MNRRSFFKSMGGAVAAVMLPFGLKEIKLKKPSFLDEVLEQIQVLKAHRHAASYGDWIEFRTDSTTADKIRIAYIDWMARRFIQYKVEPPNEHPGSQT